MTCFLALSYMLSPWQKLSGHKGLWRKMAPDETMPRGAEVSMRDGKNYIKVCELPF